MKSRRPKRILSFAKCGCLHRSFFSYLFAFADKYNTLLSIQYSTDSSGETSIHYHLITTLKHFFESSQLKSISRGGDR